MAELASFWWAGFDGSCQRLQSGCRLLSLPQVGNIYFPGSKSYQDRDRRDQRKAAALIGAAVEVAPPSLVID